MYTYLMLNIFSIAIPFAFSFDKRTQYYRSWGPLFSAITLTGIFFIIWDVYFTAEGIWGFNDLYLTGINIINLPIEEWLFFVTIPYSCVFIYVSFEYYWGQERFSRLGRPVSAVLIIFLVIIFLLNAQKAYTSITFLLLAVFLIFHFLLGTRYLGLFFISYAVILIPFFVVNGILTGSFIPEQVVWYNNEENLGIRLGTIPVEDLFYGMLLILMNVTIFELLRARNARVK